MGCEVRGALWCAFALGATDRLLGEEFLFALLQNGEVDTFRQVLQLSFQHLHTKTCTCYQHLQAAAETVVWRSYGDL